jgi:hypothetical protein
MGLSERKLYSLEPPVGGRDEATLLRGVLVREAVRSAWRSVESGQQVEVNNWQSDSAMGLDVIGEEEEDEEEEQEAALVEERNERWFEELVQSFGDDDGVEEHEWAESEVGTPIDYDEFDDDEFEHYTLPSPPVSPIQAPTSPSFTTTPLSTISSPPKPSFTLVNDPEPADVSSTSISTVIAVEVVEVDSDYGYQSRDDHIEGRLSYKPNGKDARPLTPYLSATCSPPSPTPIYDDLEDDDLVLPPSLHRCPSTSSVRCFDCTDEEDGRSDDGCLTPPLLFDTLELSVGSVLSLANDGNEYPDVDNDYIDYVVEKENQARSRRDSPTLGLGLDMGVEVISFS